MPFSILFWTKAIWIPETSKTVPFANKICYSSECLQYLFLYTRARLIVSLFCHMINDITDIQTKLKNIHCHNLQHKLGTGKLTNVITIHLSNVIMSINSIIWSLANISSLTNKVSKKITLQILSFKEHLKMLVNKVWSWFFSTGNVLNFNSRFTCHVLDSL